MLALYRLLEQLKGNPMVSLSRIVAQAMVNGPIIGLEELDRVANGMTSPPTQRGLRRPICQSAADADRGLVLCS